MDNKAVTLIAACLTGFLLLAAVTTDAVLDVNAGRICRDNDGVVISDKDGSLACVSRPVATAATTGK